MITNSPSVSVFSLPDADPQPTLVLNIHSRLLQANPAARNLTGNSHSPEKLLGLLPVNAAALVQSALKQNRPIENVESRVGPVILLWTFIPDPNSSQVLARARNATNDVRLHEEAVRSSRLYRLITENTTDLISRHAPDGRFIDASPASWRLLGYWPEELRGKRLEDIFPSTSVLHQLTETGTRLRDDGYATMTIDILHRDGSKRWFEIASRAIRETYTGALVEIISVSRDITSRVQSEESNRRLAEELAHAARLATLGELASSIAHEMNQPLATIVNFAGASQRYLKNARTRPEYLDRVDGGLQKIIHHANRASEVIRRLRAFLRKGQKRKERVALNDMVTNVVHLCRWETEKHQVQLITRLSPDQPAITADPVLLEQVMINLIRNGIEATVEARENGEIEHPAKVVVRTFVNPANETLIEVTDNGTGQDAQGIREMFQPFYTSKPHGLGLGLSMSRSIIEGLGGFLDARQADTGGLSLICRFPASNRNRTEQVLENQPDE